MGSPLAPGGSRPPTTWMVTPPSGTMFPGVVFSPTKVLGGPNDEINPIDLLLSALATCGTFVCEKAAQEMSVLLDRVTITVAGDFDPRGVCGEPIDPRIQALRVRLAI